MTPLGQPALLSSRPNCRFHVSFGPRAPGWGSWDWLGVELMEELEAGGLTCSAFAPGESPQGDLAVVIKHPPDFAEWRSWPATLPVIYCPVDFYDAGATIDGDAAWLRRTSRVVIHCERLRKYFAPYAPVEYLDHHVRFFTDELQSYRSSGPILWTGVRSNLGPLVEWANRHELPDELWILTNLEDPLRDRDPARWGFSAVGIRIEMWSPERHLAALRTVRAQIDIKGRDFRARHKPPTKALDALAAGMPLAMNAESSSTEHLARLGFRVERPENFETWLSQDYWKETRRFGGAIRELLSRRRIAARWRYLFETVLQDVGRGS